MKRKVGTPAIPRISVRSTYFLPFSISFLWANPSKNKLFGVMAYNANQYFIATRLGQFNLIDRLSSPPAP
jgi:hypothetical protein